MAVAAEVRENISLRRATRFSLPGGEGCFGAYTHGGPAAGLGRIGGVVALGARSPPLPLSLVSLLARKSAASSPADRGRPSPQERPPRLTCAGGAAVTSAEKQQQLAHQLAMHVVAMKPSFVDASALPADVAAEQRAALAEKQARAHTTSEGETVAGARPARPSGPQSAAFLALPQKDSPKPPAVVAKIIDGQLNKWCAACSHSPLSMAPAARTDRTGVPGCCEGGRSISVPVLGR